MKGLQFVMVVVQEMTLKLGAKLKRKDDFRSLNEIDNGMIEENGRDVHTVVTSDFQPLPARFVLSPLLFLSSSDMKRK